MLAAGSAAEGGARVLLLERNARLGRKLGITGDGRCNLTNTDERDEFIRAFGAERQISLPGVYGVFEPRPDRVLRRARRGDEGGRRRKDLPGERQGEERHRGARAIHEEPRRRRQAERPRVGENRRRSRVGRDRRRRARGPRNDAAKSGG